MIQRYPAGSVNGTRNHASAWPPPTPGSISLPSSPSIGPPAAIGTLSRCSSSPAALPRRSWSPLSGLTLAVLGEGHEVIPDNLARGGYLEDACLGA